MKTKRVLFTLVLITVVLLAGCSSRARVGALRTESKSVALNDTSPARVKIDMGAGNLTLTGGAQKLLEADFNYNVAALKPVVGYKDGTLVVRQPEISGLPILRNIAGFRNEWGVRLYDQVPMDLSVALGGGTSDLQLADLSLTGLDISLGAGISTVDLRGKWAQDLDVTIDVGAASLTLRLPKDIGVRVQVEPGPHLVETTGLSREGDFYTNDAYGASPVTMHVTVAAGIGEVIMDVEESAEAINPLQ